MVGPYVYPETGTLKNKFDIKDNDAFSVIENKFSTVRIKQLTASVIQGDYNINHYFAFHKYIFQDVFDWAGQQRKINIEKSERALSGLSVQYSDVFDVYRDLTNALNKLNSTDWDRLDLNAKSENFSKCMSQIWQSHVFREGNTRTTVVFCCQFAEEHGFPLDMKLLADNSEYVRTALVAACADFRNSSNSHLGDRRNFSYLSKIIADAIERGSHTAAIDFKAKPETKAGTMTEYKNEIKKRGDEAAAKSLRGGGSKNKKEPER